MPIAGVLYFLPRAPELFEVPTGVEITAATDIWYEMSLILALSLGGGSIRNICYFGVIIPW